MHTIKKYIIEIFPGLLISILISLVSQLLSVFIPTLSSSLCGIFIGIFLGNTIFIHSRYQKGTQFCEKRLLEYSIVLNGLILDFKMIQIAGLKGMLFILIQMAATILIAYFIARFFHFSKKFALLMGAGNAVCGSSAIGTVSPILHASDEEKGISITIVNIIGTFLMILLPILSSFLYGSQTLKTSALIGGTIQSIGQVVASAKLVSDQVLTLATVFKLIRVLFIILVAFLYEHLYKKLKLDENTNLLSSQNSSDFTKKKRSFFVPWFLYGFIIFFLLRNFHMIPVSILPFTKWISTQFEIIALAAIGLKINIKHILKEGPKALLCGFGIGFFQIITAIILLHFLY